MAAGLEQVTRPDGLVTAAAIVVGNNTNGWLSWKNQAGKTLDTAAR